MRWVGLFFICFGLGHQAWGKVSLNVYTSRKSQLIEPLFEAYTRKTGVAIRSVNGKAAALIQKLKREGKKTKADLLITVDVGHLWQAAEKGILMPLKNPVFKAVPEFWRDSGNRWVGLSLRARTLFYNSQKVSKGELKSYEDLASKKWKARLCLRTSRKVYNQSLVAALLIRLGEERTEKMLRSWVHNLAQPVFTSDTQLLEAIDRGICHVGIANTYYLARLIRKNKAKNIKIFWPSKEQGGVHVNISGAGVVTHSPHPQEARAFFAMAPQF